MTPFDLAEIRMPPRDVTRLVFGASDCRRRQLLTT